MSGAVSNTINRRKFLTDDNVLRLAAGAAAASGIHAAAFPEHFHDFHCTAGTARSVPHIRWMGVALSALAAQTAAPTFGGNDRARKNALKVVAGAAIVGGVRQALMLNDKYGKKDVSIGMIAGNVALAGMSLRQAYKKEIL